jgi:hypothetical protein
MPNDFDAPVTTLDHDAGTGDLAALSDEIEALEATLAPLRAVHGAWGTWEHERKVLLSGILAAIKVNGEKVTDKHADALAHDDPRYRAFLSDAAGEKAKLLEGEARLAGMKRQWELGLNRMWNQRKAMERFER